jgi:heme oxygenase
MTILLRLKQATAERHVGIESRSVLLDPALSRAGYRACLQRFWGYYEPLERQVLRSKGLQEAGFCYAERHKAPQLAQDLAALGVTPAELAKAPLCQALPSLRSTARILGCLYVIEGATLGGQIVSRHLQAKLGVTPQTGGAFFSGYGPHTGSRWKAFGAHLSHFALASGHDDDILASANDTFDTLDLWLHPAHLQSKRHHELASGC